MSRGAVLDLIASEEDPVLLDSSALHEQYGRFSIVACCPIEVLALREGVLRNRSDDVLAADDDEAIWRALSDALSAVRLTCPAPVGYVPGWIGYVGYEVGRHIERLPGRAVRDTHLPDLRLAFHDSLLVYDAVLDRWALAELRFADPPGSAGRAGRVLREVAARARLLPDGVAPRPADRADASARATIEDAKPNFTPRQYQAAVAKCIDYIAAGDIFQVNLSQRFAVEPCPSPLDIYRTLRRRNPAWYAAYLGFQAAGRPCAVLSSSPELFLRVRDGRVITRPIKGTRPRVGVAATDDAAMADLLASPKDNAELAMIIDLLRNDLGRLCRFGTIRVAEPRRLETHPTVFHLVGTVEGVLRENVGPAELLRATLPGGSITGAPKIRAMEIIDELEGVARGVYTGCVGIVSVNGACEWNIAIRTIICEDDRALLQVGGGIVADSDPVGEYDETLHKARAMLEAIAEARHGLPLGHRAVWGRSAPI